MNGRIQDTADADDRRPAVVSALDDASRRQVDEPGFRLRLFRLGEALGAETLGATVYVIDPGQCGMPYHVHHANEELLLVLGGKIDVRTPHGRISLEEGDAIVFVRGRRGAHQVINQSDRSARYLVVSTLNAPEIAEFPDTGKIYVLGHDEHERLEKIIDGSIEREWLAGEPTFECRLAISTEARICRTETLGYAD